MADNQAEGRKQLREFKAKQQAEFISEGREARKRLLQNSPTYARQQQATKNRIYWEQLLQTLQATNHKAELHTDKDKWQWIRVSVSYCVGHNSDFTECGKKNVVEGVRRGVTASLNTVLQTTGLFEQNAEWKNIGRIE